LFSYPLPPQILALFFKIRKREGKFLNFKNLTDSSSSNQVNLKVKNKKKQRPNIQKNLWSTDKLAQINKCQNKIFGNEVGIQMEFYLDKPSQKIILDSYFNENFEFKQAYERYMKTCRTKNEIEVYLKHMTDRKKFQK